MTGIHATGENVNDIQRRIFDTQWMNDPYPMYAILRREMPVCAVRDTHFHFVSRYDDIATVLKDPATFSSRSPGFMRLLDNGDLELRPAPANERAGRILGVEDPPVHTEQRRKLSLVFNRRVKRIETEIDAYCERLARELPRAEPFDFMGRCARDVPSWAICTLLGIPMDMQGQLVRWAHDAITLMLGTVNEEGFLRSGMAALELQQYLSGFYASVARDKPDNLSGDLAAMVEAGELEPETALGMLFQLVVGGADTTASWIGNTLLLLLRDRDAIRLLQDENARVALLEETLRLETPSQGNYRVVTTATELAGTRLPAGAALILLWGSANRDESVYSQPDAIRVDRETKPHLGFGRGIHACLGANLARTECRAVFTALANLVPKMRPVDDLAAPDWTPSLFSRQLETLPVCIDTR